jgi:hypothetical protein
MLGREIDTLAAKPNLHEGFLFIVDLFFLLHRTRGNSGFGPLPLQITNIESLLRIYKIKDIEEAEFYLQFLLELDQAWLEKYVEDTEKETNSKGNSLGKK